ncbi:hypothetical protein CABS01_17075, partial [Colletotrichum abscissum]|uniref:uncharacterized protein n=1 Tax=Colletotrichum abscissum TaxID=1671311 RepID=UPI0027D583EA
MARQPHNITAPPPPLTVLSRIGRSYVRIDRQEHAFASSRRGYNSAVVQHYYVRRRCCSPVPGTRAPNCSEDACCDVCDARCADSR